MSKRYKGAILSSTPPTTSTSSASGVWTEQQFMQGVASGSWPALAGAPTIGTATAGALSASVTFTAPTYTGSGITGYTVTSSPGGITGTGASSPITVSGLTAETSYTFTVTATTAAGQGPASAASNSVTPTAPNYIEDVFSTYLYTGNDSTQTINNGIDLANKGGLTWIKVRDYADSHRLFDTSRGVGNYIVSNSTSAQLNNSASVTSFNSNGFSLGSFAGTNGTAFGSNYASWTFRKQPKFFDVVTYTGDGTNNRAISHNLGSTPGWVIVKCTSATAAWPVWHRSLAGSNYNMYLNLTIAADAQGDFSSNGSASFTSTTFPVSNGGVANTNGATYVAYLFAHNAGGFGLTGTDNVISCGTFSTATSGKMSAAVNLGYEPQWLMVKNSGASENWVIYDNMRGMSNTGYAALNPNSSGAEYTGTSAIAPNATGFNTPNASGPFADFSNYIYVAIRRGPMKVPTSGTSVFVPIARTANGAYTQINTTFAPDLVWTQARVNSGYSPSSIDKLRGPKKVLLQNDTSAELTSSAGYDVNNFNNTGVAVESQGQNSVINYGTESGINWFFQRAPSFFDEVCYTGTGVQPTSITHNLTVAPTLVIIKGRSQSGKEWVVLSTDAPNANGLFTGLNTDYQGYSRTGNFDFFGNSSNVYTAPTATTISLGSSSWVNASGYTYVAYLFATCAGVSKTGTYTGTGSTQTIACGFTGGARFVLIKRTDSTGNWYVWDTARGMVSGTDPSLLLNSSAAEVNANSIYTTAVGFQIVSTAAGINASGGTYIFLAIA